ncbi:unnamed protein product [Coffea canephora]|uniref:DH200=94 genomic scaffold, scaffold_88 n=1 Tax=Coffea canephora TaxID=49390 RepID=A0A068V255_COFCA|nr:unnamed protein product [Coffea canephora]
MIWSFGLCFLIVVVILNCRIWILTRIKKETSKRQKRKKWECKGDLLENDMGDLPLSSCQKVDQCMKKHWRLTNFMIRSL